MKCKYKEVKIEPKEPKLFGKDEDGFYLGKIEEIAIDRDYETLYICNRKNYCWIFSAITGYKQIGTFKVRKIFNAELFEIKKGFHLVSYHEGDLVLVEKRDDKIINVWKSKPLAIELVEK